MIIILGLTLMAVATIVGLAGVLGNAGGGQSPTDEFSVFGFSVTGSTGTLFLYGIVVGVIAMLGLSLLLTGVLSTVRRDRAARAQLKQSRHETEVVSQDRDDLLRQRETDRDN